MEENMLSSRLSNGGASSNGGTTLTNGTAGQKSAQAAAAAFSTHDGTNMGDRRGLLLGLNGSDYVRLLACSGCGFVFGIAAEKARVHVPSVIQQQMLFSQNTMLKAFLTAVTTSVVMFSSLYLLPSTRGLFHKVRAGFGGCVSAKRVVAFAAGGTILGMGVTVSGACPGMVVVQVGSGLEKGMVTLLGCFTGALLYGVVEPSLKRHITSKSHSHLAKSIWMDQILGVPYIPMALGLGLLTAAVVVGVEKLVPWASDSVPVSPPGTTLLSQKSWSPIFAGLVMGSMQLPVALAVRDSLGGSSFYCILLSHSSRRLSQVLPYFSSFSQRDLSNWWQVFYWGGAAGGAALSAYTSGMWGMSTDLSNSVAFIGGVMMLFGARLASGCTSGHGLSGLALLSLASFVAVPAMFAGGISLAFARKILI